MNNTREGPLSTRPENKTEGAKASWNSCHLEAQGGMNSALWCGCVFPGETKKGPENL